MSVRLQILKRLRQSGGRPLSGAGLAREFNTSRTAVWKHVARLRAEGYRIEGVPGGGYLLRDVPDRIEPERLHWPCRLLGSVNSTNDVARAAGIAGAAAGLVVVAEEQSAGRGRRGRSWVSPRGGLYFSVLLRPVCHPSEAPRLTLLAAVAVAEALAAFGLAAAIKWPNDLVLAGRKCCGILVESLAAGDSLEFAVLGVGLNANVAAADLPAGATSLALELGRPVDRTALLNALLERIMLRYEAALSGGWPEVLAAWRARSLVTGRRVTVSGPVGSWTGVAEDVDLDGALLLRTAQGGLERILAGDVTLRPELP